MQLVGAQTESVLGKNVLKTIRFVLLSQQSLICFCNMSIATSLDFTLRF